MEEAQRRELLVRHGVEVLGPLDRSYAQVLTPDALAFVAELHKRFDARRRALLAARDERQARLDAGELPNFLPETRHIRQVYFLHFFLILSSLFFVFVFLFENYKK